MTHRRWDRSKSPERYLLSQGLPSGALPPAIRPGLHCGGWTVGGATTCPPSSPGHQAGAPLRPSATTSGRMARRRLPPAIRPGLHCGSTCTTSTPSQDGGLPPAIRPGLHCGTGTPAVLETLRAPSPGHQAGAPLRLSCHPKQFTGATASPGHQAGAPLRPGAVEPDQLLHDGLPPAIRPGLHCGTHGASLPGCVG